MPLIIVTGIPSSGKTTRVREIEKFFIDNNKNVEIVSEEEQIVKAGFEKNAVYLDASKEKHIRGLLKSEVLKLLGPNSVVILDGSNYIKGYRYELYCAAKANKCTQCTVHTEINRDVAWDFNENRPDESQKYTREVFDALVMRYEDPDSKNRWDSPLFMAFPTDPLNLQAMAECLLDKKPPAPNQSTQNAPLSATNFLYDLDKVTKEITDSIVKAKTMGAKGEIKIPGYENLRLNVANVTIPQLMMLRRQYITYSKMHAPEVAQIPQLYIQYLKNSFNL
uniref:Protein KTI12 homolog n=1 Tax=Photinus pyralis TaxID=7054 RepID=A0A1Y1K590_PHOPY